MLRHLADFVITSVFLADPQATCCKIEKTSHFWMGILMEKPTWSPDLCTDFHLDSLLSKGEREEGPKGGTIFNCTLICSPLSLSLAQKSTYWTSTLVVLRFVMFQFWARERERGDQKGDNIELYPNLFPPFSLPGSEVNTLSFDTCNVEVRYVPLLSQGEREGGPKGGTILNCTLICSPPLSPWLRSEHIELRHL